MFFERAIFLSTCSSLVDMRCSMGSVETIALVTILLLLVLFTIALDTILLAIVYITFGISISHGNDTFIRHACVIEICTI